MRNGFGLKLLHKFFNLPFLQLQRETLLKQLARNEAETDATIQELDAYGDSDEANYNKFLDNLVKKRREIADSNANIPTNSPQINISAASQQSANVPQSEVKRSQSGPIVIGAGKPIPFSAGIVKATPRIPKSQSQNSGFVTKLGVTEGIPDIRRLEISPITSVEEFCPDGGQLDRSFLDDVQNTPQSNANDAVDSDR